MDLLVLTQYFDTLQVILCVCKYVNTCIYVYNFYKLIYMIIHIYDVCMYVYALYKYKYRYIYVHKYILVFENLSSHLHIYLEYFHICIMMNTHMISSIVFQISICQYAYTYMCVYIHVYICTCIYTYVYTNIYVCKYIFICT
jgi:hypothetical protein